MPFLKAALLIAFTVCTWCGYSQEFNIKDYNQHIHNLLTDGVDTIRLFHHYSGKHGVDSMVIQKIRLYVSVLSEPEYKKFISADADLGERKNSNVKMNKDSSFFLVPKDGDTLKFKSNKGANVEEANAYGYTYEGYLSEIGSWLIQEWNYEADGYSLISHEDGSRIFLQNPSQYCLSPDKKYFVIFSTYGWHLEAFLELYEISGKAIGQSIGRTSGWGPSKAFWVNNRTLVGDIPKLDDAGNSEAPPIHIKIEIK